MKKLVIFTLLSLTLFLLGLTSCQKPEEGTDPESTTTAPDTPPAPPESTTPSQGDFSEPDHAILKNDRATVTSLDGKLTMEIYQNSAGALVYTLSAGENEILGESALGLAATNFAGFDGALPAALSAKRLTATYPYLGSFSEVKEDCVAATLTLKKDSALFASIEIKLYDNGLAFRYRLPKTGTSRSVRGEATTFAVKGLEKVWYGQNSDCYESEITSSPYRSISTAAKLTGPLTMELAGDRYLSLMEGYVDESYIGTNFAATGKDNTFRVTGSWSAGKDFDTFSTAEDIVTGWRVIAYAEELGDLVTNTIIYNTALGMEGDTSPYTDTGWITPGKSVWSWINDRGVPFEPQINYTLNAARLGFAYNIIDEGYPSWEDYEAKLTELGLLGEENGVKQILWGAVTGGHNGVQIASVKQAAGILDKLAGWHMSGIKLDFFNSETNKTTHAIQQKVLEEAMKREIIVNFHGVHKPTSLAVLYPNELTREGIRGLENMARNDIAGQARYIVRQYYTRFLSGHGDFTPDANTAMQIASLVVMDSPLMVIATDPKDMLQNPALELIRAIPTVWDRTVFLDGSIGNYVSVAKEKDGVFYIGGIAATTVKNASVELAKILGEGNYLLTGFIDRSTSRKEKIEKIVTAKDVLEIGNLSAGLGYILQITKLDLSQHGGEITGPVTVKTASPDAVVKYTLDGSDPMTSESALALPADGRIDLSESCTLTVAITEGDGAGTKMTYRFAKIAYNSLETVCRYEDEKTTVTLTPTLPGAAIHYTTDGSTPTASSPRYSEPLVFTKTVTLKAVAISPEGKVSPLRKTTVLVRKAIQTVLPDVYIGKDYKEAVAGWDNRIGIDKSMNNTPLSLGGTNAQNGTRFTHGISTNAIGYFVYDIPENAKEFVGVVGIDDSTFQNAAEGHKASIICTITVDGKVLYTSPKLGQSQYDNIRISLPEGASRIKIHFGDAGDGITCDNATLANGGFLLG